MKAEDLSKIAMMDIVEQSNEKSRPILPPPKQCENPMNLTWAPFLVFYPERIEQVLKRLSGDLGNFTVIERKPEVVDVFGVKKDRFIEDMENLGEYRQGGRPYDVYRGRPMKDIEPLKQLFFQAQSYDFSLVWKLLMFECSQQQFEEALALQISRRRWSSFVSATVSNPQAFAYLKKLTERGPQFKYRVAFLVTAVLQNEPTTQLVQMWLTNLTLLEAGVSYVNLVSTRRVKIIPMMRAMNRGFEMITRCYLLSVLLELMADYSSLKWYQEQVEPCRRMCAEVCKYLQNKQFLDMLRMPANPEMYKVQLMMLGTSSSRIHEALLGKDFLIWINNSPKRPGMLNTIAHSRVIFTAAQLLVQALSEKVLEPLDEFLNGMKPEIATFLAQVLRALRKHFDLRGCRFSGQTLLPLFEAVSKSNRECVAECVVPLADIISSRSIISNFGTTEFQPLLVRAVCNICKIINISKGVDFREKIQTLIMLAGDESCCFAMVQVPGFKFSLIGHLTDKDVVSANRAWELFINMSSYPRVLGEFISDTGALIRGIIDNKTQRMPLKRMLELVIRILKRRDPDNTKKLMDILSGCLGQISCLFKTRFVTFKHDPVMINIVSDFYTTLLETGDDRFLEQFAGHMTTAGDRPRDRAKTMRTLKSQYSLGRPDLSVILSS